MSEFEFLGALLQKLAANHAPNQALAVPPGDDTAEVLAPGGKILFAADMLLDGVHFDLRTTRAALAGRKALAVNLSDIAAMAGDPAAVVVSLALTRGHGVSVASELMRGVAELAAEFGVAIAGGDTNSWDGPVAINVAITGRPHARGSVLRSGAKAGDAIYVTGPLGGSLARGRHLSFTPRIAEAKKLHTAHGLHAMIDLSDGLGSDLRHILTASNVGAILNKRAIPIHADAGNSLDRALSDGEDFELCFTVASAAVIPAPSVRIGRITATPGLTWDDGQPVTARGYAHDL